MGIQWLIIVSILIVVLQGWMYRKWGLRNVSYTRYFSTPAVYAGQSVDMIEIIANRKLLLLPWIRLESMISADLRFNKQSNLDISEGQYYQNHKSLFSLGPYTQITRRHEIVCMKRGYYTLQSVTITCGDVFGFMSRSSQLNLNASLLVYPKLIPTEEIPLPSHSWQGDLTVRRWIVSDPFLSSGVREYRYGDPMNRINWKATARTGRLQVHNEDFTANQRLMIYVNFDLHEQMWDAVTEPEAVERALSYAASIAQHSILQGRQTGFGCNGYFTGGEKKPVRIEPQTGSEHLTELLSSMARLAIARSIPFYAMLDQDLADKTSQTDFLIITAFVNDKLQTRMDRLRALGNSVGILPLETGVKEQSNEQSDGTPPEPHRTERREAYA